MTVVYPQPAGQLEPRSTPPTFSFIVPVYQGASTVGTAVRSILEQRTPVHEVIVCDDGSTDDLDGALAPFSGDITLLRQENRGVYAARNLGLNHASGEFIGICDSDDWLLPGLVESWTAMAMERPDLDILGRTSYLVRDGQCLGPSRAPDSPAFDIEDQRFSILQVDFIGGCSAFRRQRLIDLGGYDESLRTAGDYDSFVRLILSGSRAGLNFEPHAVIEVRDDSLSRGGTRGVEGLIAVLGKVVARTDLSEEERAVAAARHRVLQLELELTLAKRAVHEHLPEARTRSLQVARNRQHPLGTRVKAAAAFLSPRIVARLGRL
jgi:glycosyltransferase involved in cell wall biosynthesis